ncbi:hypothetical protein ABW20_dc0102970 [Dactylellina cionopaga]|nr:hypothetical protein ABW20_dc0102970 [Dactylellina cionopaga]
MARKLKHRERRRIGRRERRNASKKGDGEGEEMVALDGENASQSDEALGNGSESGELDSSSPQAGDLDGFDRTDRKHHSGMDGADDEGGSDPGSSMASLKGGSTFGDHSSADVGTNGKDEMSASNSRRPSSTALESESGTVSFHAPGNPNVGGDQRTENYSRQPAESHIDPPTGLRFQPPSGPRNPDIYQFGRGDRGSGRGNHNEDGFKFETDSRGLNFPQTESGFRDRRYRDTDRRFGDRRGFHTTNAPRRFNEHDRGDQRAPWFPPPAHDRPLLHLRRSATPEQFPAMVAAKRQRMDDEGEVEMDIDSLSDSPIADSAIIFPPSVPEGGQDLMPAAPQIESDETPLPTDSTVPESTADKPSATGKKIDVISMIRQAKKELVGNRKDTSATSGDFISLSDLEEGSRGIKEGILIAENIPTGPRARYNSIPKVVSEHQTVDRGVAPGTSSSIQPLSPPPGLSANTLKKRRYSDMEPSQIIDFYDYIKPQSYEHIVRHDLVRRLRALVQRYWQDADIQAFGSFAAEIYLPTSDMDVVLLSKQFLTSGRPKYNTTNEIRKLVRILRNSSLPQEGTLAAITGAKVPIIKYKDRLTGLSVDISFENPSGLIANRTFRQWKEIYPEMPKLALLLKHFLSIRKINEPFNGGLGSFSLICMIISLLQLMPEASSGNWHEGKDVSLGRILMEFLELYGTKFNTVTTGIRVREPGYFQKTRRREHFNPGKPFLLSIEDPNDPNNNISKASYRILDILKEFSKASRDLNTKMNQLHGMPFDLRKHESVLAPMIGGYNYSPITQQRRTMKNVFLNNNLGTLEELKALGGGDPSSPSASFTVSADGAQASVSLHGDTVVRSRNAPTVEAPHHKQKELKKQRRAAKVKSRFDQSGAPAGHAASQPSKKKKKPKKVKPKGKQPA